MGLDPVAVRSHLTHHRQPWERLVGQTHPRHPLGEARAAVVAGRVLGDEPQLAHPGLQDRAAHHRHHPLGQADHLGHPAAVLGGREVGADPAADRRGGTHVEHLAARVDELVDPRGVGQPVGQVPLASALGRHRVGGGGQVLQVRDAERAQPAEQSVQHVDRGARVGQRAVVRLDRGVEVGGQGGQLVVADLVPRDGAAGEGHGVQHGEARPRVAEVARRGLEEADVEPRVVRDEHRAARRTPGTTGAPTRSPARSRPSTW